MDLSERRSTTPQRHPWELARARFIEDLMRRHGATDRPSSWLDVGAGDGWLGARISRTLLPGSRVTCWDAFYTDDDLDHLRSTESSLEYTTTQPTDRFDVISLFDVIEHVADDHAFLSDVLDRNLADDGAVFVTVPAHPALFSSHDVALHHYRRYRPRECRDLLQRCGLAVERDGGLFATLIVPRAAAVVVDRVRSRNEGGAGIGSWRGGPTLTRLIGGVLELDNRLALAAAGRTSRYPGLSYWAIGHRR